MSYTTLLKNVWDAIYAPETDEKEIVEKYFHPNYEQCINGIKMNRTEYIQHVIEQKQNMQVNNIEYKHIIEKDCEVFALYYPKGKNNDNQSIQAEVIAYFSFKDQQILRIHGQVRLLEGNLADVDMEN